MSGDKVTHGAENDAAYREQAEALIADLRARLSHVEAERDEQIAKVLRLDAEFQTLVAQAQAADRAYEALWESYRAALRCIEDERQLRLAATHITPPGQGHAPESEAGT